MKRQTILKGTLCLLMALVCNVTWAQTSYFKMGTSTTSLSDGNYVLVAMSDKGTGPVIYDPNAGEGKHYRYEAGKTFAAGDVVSSKYVWTIDETTADGVQHIIVTNYDDNTKAFPADESRNQNFTGSGVASLLTEVKTIGEANYIALSRDIVVSGNTLQGYVHANAPSGNPCLSYWDGYGDDGSCIKFTFFPVNALTNEERLTYNVGDGKYNDRAGSSSNWRNGWTSTNVGKPSFTISVGANNVNANSADYIGLRPGSGGCTYTLTLGETFTGYSFEAKSTNTAPSTNNPDHVVTINGKETTISSTEWTTVRADVVGTTASFGLKGSNGHDLYIRNVKFEQNAEVLAAATANTNINIFGLQRYLGLVQNAGTGLEGNGQLICNYPAPTSKESGNAYANLLDGTYTTFFHSGYENYRGDGSSHYLQANLGKAVKSFRFYFKKRSQNNNNRPKEILIEGSVDGNTFEEIKTISDGMPSGAAPTDYYSDEITASKAYKYLRFTVKKTHNDESSGNPFFTFSEFYILPNTPKVAETFDAVRGFRAGATVENATKLNEVYAWHQGFTGDAYPNDLYEGVYTLTINGPAAATATYNGESKALPATFYVTEEVAEENAAVTIASTESTLSFNCFSDETDTYETLTVTSLTENKVYTANFNYSLELKESTGGFTEGSKVWSLTTNATNPVALTFTSNANNMNHHDGYIQLHSGQATSSTYTLTVPEGYIILEYSFDYAFGSSGTGDKKFVVGGQDYPVAAESQSLSVENVNATTTQFVLSGANQPVKVQNFIVKVKAPTAKEITDAKKTAKDGVDANADKLQQDLGYYSYTIGGAKVYTIDEVKAAIDAAATIVEVNAITASFALNVPEVGKCYRIKGISGNYIDAVQCYSGDQMGMKSNETCNYLGTIFLLDEGNRLKNVATGTYVHGTRHIGATKANANTWTFAASERTLGCITLTAAGGNSGNSTQLHDNSGNRADRCSSICGDSHDFTIEEVEAVTLTYKYTYNESEIAETTMLVEIGMPYPTPSAPFGFAAITTLEGIVKSEDAGQTFVFECESNTPFEYADSYENITKWYYMQMHSNNKRYIEYIPDGNYLEWADASLPTTGPTSAHIWAFVGDPINGFKLYNRSAGAKVSVKSTGDGNPTMAADGTAFLLAASTETGNGFFCLQYPDGNYLNAQDGKVAHWGDNDAGSTILLTEAVIDGYYIFSNAEQYLSDDRKSDGATQRVLTQEQSAKNIFYYDGYTLIGYSSGYGFEYGICNTKTAGAWNSFTFEKNNTTGEYYVKSDDGTSKVGYADGYWKKNNNELERVSKDNASLWTLTAVKELPVTISSVGYATFIAPVALEIPEGVKAYTGTVKDDYLVLTEVTDTIPANTGVVLEAAEATYNFTIVADQAEAIASDLVGSVAAKANEYSGVTDEDIPYYTLQPDGNGGVVFKQFNGDNLAGSKAYLVLPAGAGAGAISIRFEGSTDIENVEIRNEKSEMIFDLLGRRVETITKGGIYIVNGKKVVVK